MSAALVNERRWMMLALAGIILLPWYRVDSGAFGFDSLARFPDRENAPALLQLLAYDRWWLLLALAPVATLAFRHLAGHTVETAPRRTMALATLGLALTGLQGFAIIHNGPAWGWISALVGPETTQAGMGYGALAVSIAYLLLLSNAMAAQGACRGDSFVTGAIAVVVALISLFVFFPVLTILSNAVTGPDGGFTPVLFIAKFFDRSIWGLDCVTSGLRCGVAWNTVFLGILVGAGTTLLGLAFALVTVRTGLPGKPLLRALTVLPIITPPFVIGLALILLFGRSGLVTDWLWDWFAIPPSRWIYGLPGVFLAQMLAFTPIAFLVLIGVVQGISPSLEEASQTLRATPWATFRTVTWPLMRPGVANAFLLGFIESLADFGNPLVLGGNFEVLSTTIFFAVVGAANDEARAAVLAIVLLIFTLAAFWAQHHWLGRRLYTTMTGKGDAGLPTPLPTGVKIWSLAFALPWAVLTIGIYATIIFAAFVRAVGRDHTFTLEHFWIGFSFEVTDRGLHLTGAAWDSFWTTLAISAVSAPLTAAVGLLTAYLLVRQRFRGQRTFEFGTMLSFAIPGTVIGVSYILAFNTPPVELTGTGIILVICFVFRNMPVGVRAGIASLAQIDKSIDEASLMLGARTATTVRRVILPLIRPAIIAAMVYSFVRAMTAVSAVIFLVSAQYNMSTAYIVGRVEAGEFGLAIAYSTMLIAVMLAAILLIQFVVGERRLGRRSAGGDAAAVAGAG